MRNHLHQPKGAP